MKWVFINNKNTECSFVLLLIFESSPFFNSFYKMLTFHLNLIEPTAWSCSGEGWESSSPTKRGQDLTATEGTEIETTEGAIDTMGAVIGILNATIVTRRATSPKTVLRVRGLEEAAEGIIIIVQVTISSMVFYW